MDKKYTLEGATINYEFGFEGDKIYYSMIRKLGECRVDQITKVILKKTALSSGEEISFRIFYNENGKEKKFNWVDAKITSSSTNQFFEDLKSRIPENTPWEDLREKANVDESGRTVYDLQYLLLGYAGSGLARSVQIWVYLLCFAIFVIPAIYYIYLLVTGGYRIYTDDGGIEIKKTGSTKISWNDFGKVELTTVNVIQNYSSSNVLDLIIHSKSGTMTKVVMRFDHAIPLLKELAKRGLVSEEMLAKYA